MKILRICVFFCALLSSSILSARTSLSDTLQTKQPAMKKKAEVKKSTLLVGCSVGFDACGAVMAAVTPYGQYEGKLRVNLKNKFFPIVEVGLGVSNHTDETSNITYKTHSPYFRLGADYNFLKDVHSGNRLFGGLRFAYSSYKFDIAGSALKDPIYGTIVPFQMNGVKSNSFWSEVVFGAEAKVWRFLHLGWSVRYKLQVHKGRTVVDNAWYVPGYGKYGANRLGGSFDIVLDI